MPHFLAFQRQNMGSLTLGCMSKQGFWNIEIQILRKVVLLLFFSLKERPKVCPSYGSLILKHVFVVLYFSDIFIIMVYCSNFVFFQDLLTERSAMRAGFEANNQKMMSTLAEKEHLLKVYMAKCWFMCFWNNYSCLTSGEFYRVCKEHLQQLQKEKTGIFEWFVILRILLYYEMLLYSAILKDMSAENDRICSEKNGTIARLQQQIQDLNLNIQVRRSCNNFACSIILLQHKLHIV